MNQEQQQLIDAAAALCKEIYESLPDGLHRHADGKIYLHHTWSDPRTGVKLKTINELNVTL